MRVLLAGGGTAGHTSPLLATAAALRRADPECEITCLGTSRGLEVTLIPEAGYPLELVPPVPMPRKVGTDLAKVPVRLRGSVRAAVEIVDRVRPEVIVGFGGYVSVPAYLAARRRKVPLVVHEGNALPGMANKLGARFTRHVATSFPDTELPHATYTGLPIRRAISTLDRAALRDEARAEFGLDPSRPTLLVTGGSQGARSVNHAVSGAARDLADAGVQVLHAAGRPDEAQPDRRDGDPPYVVVPFIERMDLAYAAADLIVCRSGANTVTEVASVGLPAAFVPLPHGNGEQALNAYPVVQAGGALLIDDEALTPDWIGNVAVPLLSDAARLERMSKSAAELMPRDADERLAAIVVDAARESR
ncbi:undecaprenyldiphospho-muramoylpentapeptide beta-N-acetylglucosaminyltransferase [Solicola gregarius]|uniref:UDP-N-acetylglucosamine--N-acetylmuramyl-(pentapeptide) pyrophosphoryl-undecaprenol N-acetylglucosamine transferase n=1 Tax=Solicola gregarius TaxID=2908642 RepID=A0AA46TMD1_9ACTN|nr:undecaprenyldiphospho-muramoylpentapeptide beta-N-acetylglucosaminyltransferase [Solicola gregarius]UYM07941.1 undecaprenyldiphospho-muramoylpentapeptide beta-N-acetylglucosaminyltransferase [Solicola gregarius]